MQKRLKILLLLACMLVMVNVAVAEAEVPKTVRVGVLPTNTTRHLVVLYEPVRAYLEKTLQRPVVIVTASDFRAFHANTIAGNFDLIVTAAHFGRIAETEAHYIPLVRYKALHQSILITSKEHDANIKKELKGSVIAGIEPLTMSMTVALRWLRQQGLQEGRDYTLLITPTPISSAYAVKNHQAAFAVSSLQGFKQMPEDLSNDIEIYKKLDSMPSLMWLANPRMKEYANLIRDALVNFTPESVGGEKFYDMTGYQGMRAVTAEETRAIDGVAQEARRLLEKK